MFFTSYPSTIALQHSNAPTAKFGSPVKHTAPPQANTPIHRSGYFITGGVQSTTMPFTPATTAADGLEAL